MFKLDALFCPKGYRFAYDVDDFCNSFEPQWKTKLLYLYIDNKSAVFMKSHVIYAWDELNCTESRFDS